MGSKDTAIAVRNALTPTGARKVHLKHDSTIVFRQAEDPAQDIRNVSLAYVFVDEIEEFEPPGALSASTPAPPLSHA